MLQGMTAHYLTRSTFPLKAGDTCLVHAAAGGAGLLIVQMAKALGARVFGTVSTEAKAQLARANGADEIIRYTEQDFEQEVKRLTDGRGVDVVYDSVGKTTFDKSLSVLRPRGTMALFGQSSGAVPPFDPNVLNGKGSLYLTRPSLAHHVLTRDELLWRAGDVLSAVASGMLRCASTGRIRCRRSPKRIARSRVAPPPASCSSAFPKLVSMARLFARTAALVVAVIVAAAAWTLWHTRDRNRGYEVNLRLRPATDTPALRVGFGREKITPDLSRTVWLAGFENGRKATAVHDDLWAVASVIDDGSHRLGIVALDAIGLFHDDVIAIRRRVPPDTPLDYVIVASTHNHSTPDLMGLWGPRAGFSGVDDAYRARVIQSAASALVAAAAVLTPARLSLGEIPLPHRRARRGLAATRRSSTPRCG